MGYDVGPFQDIVGISFAGDNYEDLIDGEDAIGREDECEPGTEFPLGTVITVEPDTGPLACKCPASEFSGHVIATLIRVLIPLTETWPSCVLGDSSGGYIASSWPSAPSNWGQPETIESFDTGFFCEEPVWQAGSQINANQYQVLTWFIEECTPPSYDEDCC